MPSEILYREFQNLERKIQLVLNENMRLKNELNNVKIENNFLNGKMKSYEINLNAFQDQIKINKLANNVVVNEKSSTELKDTIDRYIKEIDKCIAHLAK